MHGRAGHDGYLARLRQLAYAAARTTSASTAKRERHYDALVRRKIDVIDAFCFGGNLYLEWTLSRILLVRLTLIARCLRERGLWLRLSHRGEAGVRRLAAAGSVTTIACPFLSYAGVR
jgi:hypothetical protein